MSVTIIHGDITKIEGDVIFNSVGTEADNFGGICKSILTAAGSDFLLKSVKNVKGVYIVGDVFFSNGYKLPVKKIAHLVMPNHDTDKKHVLYKKIIRNALNQCYERKLYKIGIPMLGCGANKYKSDEVSIIIRDLCNMFCLGHKEMQICIVLAPDSISGSNKERLIRAQQANGDYHSPEIIKKFEKEAKLFDESNTDNKKVFVISNDKLNKIKTINNYVEEYLNNDKIAKKRLLRYFGYGKSNKKDAASTGSTIFNQIADKSVATKDFMFKTIIALNMNLEEANNFLTFFGLGFSHPGINKRDDIIKELIRNKQFGIIEVNEALIEAKQDPLFVAN